MAKYRIQQRGVWYYPQKRSWGVWRDFVVPPDQTNWAFTITSARRLLQRIIGEKEENKIREVFPPKR